MGYSNKSPSPKAASRSDKDVEENEEGLLEEMSVPSIECKPPTDGPGYDADSARQLEDGHGEWPYLTHDIDRGDGAATNTRGSDILKRVPVDSPPELASRWAAELNEGVRVLSPHSDPRQPSSVVFHNLFNLCRPLDTRANIPKSTGHDVFEDKENAADLTSRARGLSVGTAHGASSSYPVTSTVTGEFRPAPSAPLSHMGRSMSPLLHPSSGDISAEAFVGAITRTRNRRVLGMKKQRESPQYQPVSENLTDTSVENPSHPVGKARGGRVDEHEDAQGFATETARRRLLALGRIRERLSNIVTAACLKEAKSNDLQAGRPENWDEARETLHKMKQLRRNFTSNVT